MWKKLPEKYRQSQRTPVGKKYIRQINDLWIKWSLIYRENLLNKWKIILCTILGKIRIPNLILKKIKVFLFYLFKFLNKGIFILKRNMAPSLLFMWVSLVIIFLKYLKENFSFQVLVINLFRNHETRSFLPREVSNRPQPKSTNYHACKKGPYTNGASLNQGQKYT